MRRSSALRVCALCLPAVVAVVLALGEVALRGTFDVESAVAVPSLASADTERLETAGRSRVGRKRAGTGELTPLPEPAPESAAGVEAPATAAINFEDWICSGVVRAPSGEPVAGALVALGDIDTSDRVTSDALGRFGIDELAHYSKLTAVAVIDGVAHYGLLPADGLARGVEIRLEPLPPTDPIRIVRIVGHDGRAVASATVQLVAGARPRSVRHGYPYATAVAGSFLIRPAHVAPQTERMTFVVSQARDGQGRPLGYGSALVTVDPWADPQPAVILPPGRIIAGRAERPDGGPLSRELVRCVDSGPSGYDPLRMAPLSDEATWTEPDGTFAFSVGTSRAVTLRIDATPIEHAGAIAPIEAGTSREVVLRCAPPGFRRLHVVGEGDEPLPGVSVWVRPESQRATTDANGDVDLAVSLTGRGTIEVVGGDELESVVVPRATDAEPQTIRLRRIGRFSGIVLGPDGHATPGVAPAVVQPRGFAAGSSEGRFYGSALASAPLTLRIRGPADAWFDTQVPADADRNDLVLRIPEVGDALAICTGRADVQLPISVRREGVEIERRESGESLTYFVIPERIPSVDLQVGPDSEGRFALLRDVSPRGFLRVGLVNGASVSGRVTTAEGHHVPYADVVVTTPDGFRATATAERDGRVTLRGVPPGRVTVSATWRNRRGQVEIDAPSDKLAIVLE